MIVPGNSSILIIMTFINWKHIVKYFVKSYEIKWYIKECHKLPTHVIESNF